MMPSLFKTEAVTTLMEQDRHSPSSQRSDIDGFVPVSPIQDGGLPERLREMHLDTESTTSETAISFEDDDGSIPSQEAAPLPKTQPTNPDHSNFLERYRHENKWLELKNKPIPSSTPELDEWAEEWSNAYKEGFRLNIPRFISDGSRMAILDLMAAFKLQDAATYEDSFLKEYTVSVEESDISEEFSFEEILGRIATFWPEVKENAKPNPDIRGKQSFSMELYRIFYDWNVIKASDIPSARRDLEPWLDRWTSIYYRAVEANFPYFFEDDSYVAKRDFIYRFFMEPGWDSFFNTYWRGLQRNTSTDSFPTILAKFQREWLQKKEAEEEKMKCVCGFKNHQKWSECYYLNELIRPEGWIPKSKIMARIDEQAETDKKLKKIIRNHKKKQLPPPPPKQEEPKKDEDEDDEEEENQGPIRVLFPILAGKAIENNEKIKTSFFVLSNTPYHICNDRSRFTTFKQRDPTLLQNRINCMNPLGTTLGIRGVGEVIIQATTPDGKEKGRSIKLGNVKYCPKAPCNAVSTQRFNTRGVYFNEERLMLYYITGDNERKDFAKVEHRFDRHMLEYNLVE